jgi:hypothetical protein
MDEGFHRVLRLGPHAGPAAANKPGLERPDDEVLEP